jgi:signal peptidase I
MDPSESPEVSPNPVIASPTASAAGQPQRTGETTWGMVRSLLIILIGVFCIRTFIGEATVIPTGSMEDTILVGDHVFLNKLLYGPSVPYTDWRLPRLKTINRGDIIAFHYPRNPSLMYVKRVIGVGGDVIRIENKQVYLNGKPLDEPYAVHDSPGMFPLRDNFPPSISEIQEFPDSSELDPVWARQIVKYIRPDGLHVPRGYVFSMGDNRDDSSDSRFWGFVPLKNIVGEPLFVYWSYDAPSRDWLNNSFEGRLQFDGSILMNFVHNTRWSRIGKVFENPY